MSDTVIVALISASGTFLTAVTALVLNHRGFASIDARFSSLDARMLALESRVTAFQDRVNQRFDDLTGAINELDKRLTKVEIKLGIEP